MDWAGVPGEGETMNELRVLRLLRELRCDPIEQAFESLFFQEEDVRAGLHALEVMPSPGAIPDEDETRTA